MTNGADGGAIRAFSAIEASALRASSLRRVLMRLGSIMWPRPPYPLRSHEDRHVISALERLLAGRRFDVGIWVTPAFADHGLRVLRAHCERVVYDAIDSSYSAMIKEPGKSILGRWDAFWVKRWERDLSSRADAAIYISKGDIELLGRGSAGFEKEVSYLPNGVLIDDFTTECAQIDGIEPGDFVIGFLGNMAYPPNIRAAQRLARIFRKVRPLVNDARLLIIGTAPTDDVQALAKEEGIVVTGRVENIWNYVNRVDVFVFPMETGAGQQNKVIEAMFAFRPVVATPVANLGVGARPGEDILVGKTDEEISACIARLSRDRFFAQQLGRSGHEFVSTNYSWDAILPRFEEVFFGDSHHQGNTSEGS
jgi:glycosyltransferase involved in cell wall biosynthesis